MSACRCPYRVVQNGPNPHLNIVDIAGKGQGVVAGVELRAGQFVCEYAGEVMINDNGDEW